MVYKMEPKYGDKNLGPSEDALEVKDPNKHYDDIAEEFLDEVYEYESKLERKLWVQDTAAKQSYIFSAKLIRDKLEMISVSNVCYTSRKEHTMKMTARKQKELEDSMLDENDM